jgi:hypothetical protein
MFRPGALVEGGKARAGDEDRSGQHELNKLKMRGRVLGGSKVSERPTNVVRRRGNTPRVSHL